MDTILRQLPLQTDADVLLVHHHSMELAKKAGLSTSEQLSFVCRITQHCLISYGPEESVTFSIHRFEDRYILRAATNKKQGRIMAEAPYPADNNYLSNYTPTELNNTHSEENYLHMQQFTLAVSHELKNSITKVKLAVSLVEEEPLPDSMKAYIGILHRAADRMEHTLRSLNDIIQLGHGKGVVETILPAAIFNEVREDFLHALGAGTRIEVNFAPAGDINYIDIYLRSIFSNVISNAIKYAMPGRPLRLQAKAIRKDDYVVFSFTDNGRGIDLAQYGTRLFDPFTRFSTDTEGSGIGLYLIKNMTEHNGGKIEVESEPGIGTTFHFFLREYTP